ncbi:transporter substrate-binding domain-containing protein [Marinobacter sp. CHS3-4]|uniref:transporter substrate-binding domain-containing protein n=1 Tax=Marinobacter sp. CHS3-4 TaxID=3045174 RepID=UPI0024B57D31|nr:transporter substrate-binding domain-containing protein [Marinobacter sp. CHS3-4]MDI9246503.1 transporter substrate-binding domain-containing protein [Marinobacter sp. CHS3-4]
MKAAFRCLLYLACLLGSVSVLADPPQSSPAPVLGSDDLDWLEARKSFRVGVRSDQVPLVFDTGEGKLAGVFIDYLNTISNKLDVPIEQVTGDAEQLDQWLEDGVIDARLSTRSVSRPASDGVRVSAPLMSLTYGLFVATGDAGIQELADLENTRIALVARDANQYAMLDSVKSFTPLKVDTLGEAVSMVLSGKADAFLGPVAVVSDYLRSAMVNGVRLARLMNQQSVDVVFETGSDQDRVYRALNQAVLAISHSEHRSIRQPWLQSAVPETEDSTIRLSDAETAFLQRNPGLKVAVRPDWPPFGFAESGEPRGLVPDLIQRLEQQLSVRFDRQVLDTGQVPETMLEQGKVDIVPDLTRTPRLEESFLFTRAYLTVPIALAIREEGRFIGELRQLRDERVGVVNRQAGHDYLLINHPDLNLYPVQSVEEGLLALSNGDLDVMVTHIPAVSYTVARLGLSNLRITSITPYQYELRFAVRKDQPELLGILNKALSSLDSNETESIYNRWIHLDIEQETDYTVVRRIVLIAVVVVLIFLYWNRKLSREVDERIRSENALRRSEDELRAAKQDAERLARQAEAASRSKSEFLANMSHEIRTPMNAVIGYSDLLSNTVTDPQQRNYLDSIRAGSRSLLMLINDILDLSRIEAGKMRLDYSAVSMRRLLSDVRHIFDLRATEQGISLEVSVDSKMPVAMRLDETRLRQVLFNLVGNAIKFTHEGGVTVRATATPQVDPKTGQPSEGTSTLVVTVKDTGIGIPEDQQQQIFDAFEQQEGQNSRRYGGTGLGLAISRKLVEMMGGKLEVQSEAGVGSIFTVTLPNIDVTVEQAEDDGQPQESDRLLAETLSMQERGWLREQLSRDFGDEWQDVRESGDPEQMRAFAERVIEWGRRLRSPSVTQYGEKLLVDVEAFNLDAVNSALESFPRLLGRGD